LLPSLALPGTRRWCNQKSNYMGHNSPYLTPQIGQLAIYQWQNLLNNHLFLIRPFNKASRLFMELLSMFLSPWLAATDITYHNYLSSLCDTRFSHDPACQTVTCFSISAMPPGCLISTLIGFHILCDGI
jgi:hypothetical protein